MFKNIFLDDVRQPQACASYMYPRIGKLNSIYLKDWVVVRNYEEFKKAIEEHYPLIATVSFDHDLAQINYDNGKETFSYYEETGVNCAQFLCDFYASKSAPLPQCFIHSMNPIGCENIGRILRKHQ